MRLRRASMTTSPATERESVQPFIDAEEYFDMTQEWDPKAGAFRLLALCPICAERFAEPPHLDDDAQYQARLAGHLDGHTVVQALEQMRRERQEVLRLKVRLAEQLRALERWL